MSVAVSHSTESKRFRRLLGLILAVVLALTGALSNPWWGAPQLSYAATGGLPVYRLYNLNTGEHFYTTSLPEMTGLAGRGWNYEGVGWLAASSGTPVYRLFNPHAQGGDHYYTVSAAEKNHLISLGWHYDGVFFRSSGPVRVQVAYNPHATSGAHNYTVNANEEKALLTHGWEFGATAWQAASATAPLRPSELAAVKAGQAILAYSSGKVLDNAVRGRLTAAVQKAQLVTSSTALSQLLAAMSDVSAAVREYQDITTELLAAYRAIGYRDGGTGPVGQCTDFSNFFVDTLTTLKAPVGPRGNGGQTVSLLAAANGLPVVGPSGVTAPAVFSFAPGTHGSDPQAGHTGIVLAVNGSQITVLESGVKFMRQGQPIHAATYPMQASDRFLNLSGHLK